MQIYTNPTSDQLLALCQRPAQTTAAKTLQVQAIVEAVQQRGDDALREFSLQFDGVQLHDFRVSEQEFKEAEETVSAELKAAIALAEQNIRAFHTAQQQTEPVVETQPGVRCWRKSVAIEKVGLYIPGGSAPLFSTILMLGIPAQLAGCKEIVLCTPCNAAGKVNAAVLYTAARLGIRQIYKVGGAQAIAAMAYGTPTIPAVNKLFGPGNSYVTTAKELVQNQGVAIDLPAGPSEVLVIADEWANPEFIAADLLSQAEHGTDSQVVLVTTSEQIAIQVNEALSAQLNDLPRADLAAATLKNSFAVVVNSVKAAFELSNLYAPEHLIVAVENAENYTDFIQNAGSVFLGKYACESAGDYASGTNHTLPTSGYARSYSGVSVDSFVKKITFQTLSAKGLQHLGPAIECMAEAEELLAHKNAVSIRLKAIADENL